MHVVFRESHGLEDTGTPVDLGQDPADLVVLSFSDSDLGGLPGAMVSHFLFIPARSNPKDEPAVGNTIKRGDLFGLHDRIMLDNQGDPRPQLQRFCYRRCRR